MLFGKVKAPSFSINVIAEIDSVSLNKAAAILDVIFQSKAAAAFDFRVILDLRPISPRLSNYDCIHFKRPIAINRANAKKMMFTTISLYSPRIIWNTAPKRTMAASPAAAIGVKTGTIFVA